MSASVRHALPLFRFKVIKNSAIVRVVAELPKPYQKFYREWMGSEDKATPVHWIPKEEKWVRNPETGEVKVVQNEPIPVVYPNEMHQGLWGGEGIVEGLVKKAKYRSPVPKFWAPSLFKSVVYSEILDKYLSVVVTERALQLIDEKCGLDSYLLTTPAYDLKSLLALKLKRKLLLSLLDQDFCHTDTKKQADLIDKYKDFMISREDVEWYGYSVKEARTKYEMILKEQNKPKPMKLQLREVYLQNLINEQNFSPAEASPRPWSKRLNPFAKPPEAP